MSRKKNNKTNKLDIMLRNSSITEAQINPVIKKPIQLNYEFNSQITTDELN